MGDYVKNPKKNISNQGGRSYTDDFRDRTPTLIDVEGNINLNQQMLEGRSSMEHDMTMLGWDVGRMDLAEHDFEMMYQDWNAETGDVVPDMYDPFEAESYEFTRWAITDIAAGFYNTAVVGAVEGIAATPAIVGGAITGGDEGGFWDSWLDSTDAMGKAMSIQQSDKALVPLTDEWNAHNMGYAIGSGLGFIADMIVGSHGIGMLAKTGSTIAKANKMKRLGSFMTSQIHIQNDLYKEGRANGLSVGNSARVALPVAAIVSLSEGAAFEMLGKVATGQVLKGTSRSALNAELKALGKSLEEYGILNPSVETYVVVGATIVLIVAGTIAGLVAPYRRR